MPRTIALRGAVGRNTVAGLAVLAIALACYYWSYRQAKVLVVDRSECSAEQWEQLASLYSIYLHTRARGRVNISKLVLVDGTSEETIAPLITAQEFREIETSGQLDEARLEAVMNRFANPVLMTCNQALMERLDPENVVP